MGKIGLIVEGGGMKCAYSAGVLDAFLDAHINFDYVIAVSAGAANAASYLAGQRGRNLRFYTDWTHDPWYFGLKSYLKTGNLFGLHYIYADLTNSTGKDPLDFPALLANPTEYWMVVTDAATGTPVYFPKSALHQDDYRCIMASCALPAACKPIEIDGGLYYDGGVSDAIPVQRALTDGCDKVVAILSKPRGFVKKPEGMRLFYSTMCRRYPNTVKALNERHLMYAKSQKYLYDLEKDGKAFIFAPSVPPKMSTYTMDRAVEQQLYDLGLQDYHTAEKALQGFMQT